jgi:hypothetical protein
MKNESGGMRTGIFFFLVLVVVAEIIILGYCALKLKLFESKYAKFIYGIFKSEKATVWLILVTMFAMVVIPVIITIRIGMGMLKDLDRANDSDEEKEREV